MKLTLLCNAGLSVESADAMLLVDVPNREIASFYRLPDELWKKILNKEAPYDRVCGFWFTHDHPDHLDRSRMQDYLIRWPNTTVFLPGEMTRGGRTRMGPFSIEYHRMDHAPIPGAPPHVVTLIGDGEKTVYIAADAVLDAEQHRAYLGGRRADLAFWNSMYLSHPETRALLREAAERSYIYHMPAQRPDRAGLWKKLENNFRRYGSELTSVTVLDRYPQEIEE